METNFLPGSVGHDRFYGVLFAIAVHGAVLAAGSLGLMQKAEFGMDASHGMADVDLVAAPAPMIASESETVARKETVRQVLTPPRPDDIIEPDKINAPATPAAPVVPNAVLRTSDLNGPLGDGSSPVPGTDALP